MKRTHKTLRPLAALAGLALTATSAHADVIYQDNFDNDGLATNTGIGGGAAFIDTTPSTDPARLGAWGDDGNLTSTDAGGGWGGSSANAYSLNGFDLQNGFTLEVTYNVVNVQTRLTIGLVEEAGAVLDASGLATSGAGGTPYGIVFNPAAHDNGTKRNGWVNRYPNAPGLQFSDGSSVTQLSDAQARGTGTHTLVLQMDAASNWSYSVDGAVATTGTIGGAGFDLTRDYRFFVRNQQSSIANNIQSVTLIMTPPDGTVLMIK